MIDTAARKIKLSGKGLNIRTSIYSKIRQLTTIAETYYNYGSKDFSDSLHHVRTLQVMKSDSNMAGDFKSLIKRL